MKTRLSALDYTVAVAIALFICVCAAMIYAERTKKPQANLWERRVWNVKNSDEAYWKEWTQRRNALVDKLLENRGGTLSHWPDRPSYLPTTAEDFLDAFYDPDRKRDVYIERLDMHEFQKVNERFRQDYPLVSLVSRLQYEDTPGRLDKHSQRHQYDLARTATLLHDEWNVYYSQDIHGGRPDDSYVRPMPHTDNLYRGLRHQALEILHTEGVRAFANVVYKFGADRVPEVNQFYLYAQTPTCVDLPQDKSKLREGWYSLDDPRVNNGTGLAYAIKNLRENYPKYMHLAFYHQFTDDRNFVASFRNAAGFEPHAVSESLNWRYDLYQPPKEPKWQVERMELVGLLKHDEPVVYVSTMLPNMKQLVDGETRPLDEFESTALEKIYRGEFVVTKPQHEKLRMMGAVRAGETCLECHAVKAGEMLGAFTYVLVPHNEAKQDNVVSINSR